MSILRRAASAAAALVVATTTAVAAPTAGAIIGARNADAGLLSDSSAKITLGNMNCTATVIAPDKLLTAKHCVGAGEFSAITIGPVIAGQGRRAVSVAVHPTADLAIVNLDHPVAAPAAELYGRHLAPGDVGQAIGWGGVGYNVFTPAQQTSTTVQRRVWNVPSPDRSAILIETFVDSGRIQPGDSGGPLFVDGRIAGIAAMANEDHTLGGVAGNVVWYTPVAEHLDWISRHGSTPNPGASGAMMPLIDGTEHPTYAPPLHYGPEALSSSSGFMPLAFSS